MKIVIDIPQDIFKDVKKTYDGNDVLYCGVKYGTPLPENHGDLIDRNDILRRLEILADNKWNQEVGASKGIEVAKDNIENWSVILKGTKESTDADSD